MGKASKWFRSILGLKKHDAANSSSQPPSSRSSSKEKRRWSFVKSYRERENNQNSAATAKRNALHGRESAVNETASPEYEDTNKHAIAVAAATAAVAEAAVAAAQAAAEVVRLTSSSGRCGNYSAAYVSGRCGSREELAAIKIQSTFRGYLARRALRALRGLVRLQALVRGHIERKRTAEWLRRMQALLRAQARARAGRAQISETSKSSSKSSHFQQPGPPTPEKFEHSIRSKSTKYELPSALKRNTSKSNERTIGDRLQDQKVPSTRIGMDDEKTDKILEIDTGKPHFNPKRRNLFHSTHLAVAASDQYSHSFTTSRDSTTHQTVPSPSSCEVQSLSPLKFCTQLEETLFCTAENSPQYFSASSRGGGGSSSKRSPFSPTKSSGAQSYLSEYSDYPSYMAFTESSKAKLRSFSAPKQRPQCERSSSAKRYYSVHGSGESKPGGQKISGLHANFTNKAYPGSGHLDRLGMPLGHRC